MEWLQIINTIWAVIKILLIIAICFGPLLIIGKIIDWIKNP